jgi:membrane-associated protein
MLTQSLMHGLMTAGYIGIVAVIFAGPGLFIGFLLPGDSVLFTAGVLASQKLLNITIIMPSVILAAFLGYQVGYWFGAKLGAWLLKRPDTWYFKRQYLQNAEMFYQKHGIKALLIARLIPVVRTFVPIIAGMSKMNRMRYLGYNFIGAIIWAGGVTLLGYYLGLLIPNAEHYILPIVLVIVVLSLLPGLVHWLKSQARDSSRSTF